VKRFYLATVICTLISQGCATIPPPLDEPSQEVTFITAKDAPRSFTNWTFFWVSPEIDADAELEYTVLQADGKEYFRHQMGKTPAGQPMRSDFARGQTNNDMDALFGERITVVFRVNKGKMRFKRDIAFAFETAVKQIRGVRKSGHSKQSPPSK